MDAGEVEQNIKDQCFEFESGEIERLREGIRVLRRVVSRTLFVLKERRVLNDEEIEQVIRGY